VVGDGSGDGSGIVVEWNIMIDGEALGVGKDSRGDKHPGPRQEQEQEQEQ
jgi:hypothetical protein